MTAWPPKRPSNVELLRHTLATIAYRGGKAVRGASPEFAQFRIVPEARTPANILAHIGDLFDWAALNGARQTGMARLSPLPWEQEVARFHATLQRIR